MGNLLVFLPHETRPRDQLFDVLFERGLETLVDLDAPGDGLRLEHVERGPDGRSPGSLLVVNSQGVDGPTPGVDPASQTWRLPAGTFADGATPYMLGYNNGERPTPTDLQRRGRWRMETAGVLMADGLFWQIPIIDTLPGVIFADPRSGKPVGSWPALGDRTLVNLMREVRAEYERRATETSDEFSDFYVPGSMTLCYEALARVYRVDFCIVEFLDLLTTSAIVNGTMTALGIYKVAERVRAERFARLCQTNPN